MFCSIIGDIIDSRTLEDRGKIQKNLHNVLNELNQIYESELAAKLAITIGDEFQCLLKSPVYLFELIEYIKMAMYPVKFRFGIGFGEITTELVSEYAIGADGPVYYNARTALEFVKTTETKNNQPVRDTFIYLDSPDSSYACNIINAALSAGSLIEKSWTAKQRDVIKLLADNKMPQTEIAKKLGIGQAAVQKRIAGSDYNTYRYVIDSVKEAVDLLWEDLVHE